MSLVSNVANYGGRQPSNTQNIKQFFVSENYNVWINKKLPSGLSVITPINKKMPVYIDNNLYVTGSIYNTSDFILIIAGYKDELDKCFFSANKGLRRRFPWVYDIEEYSSNNLKDIFT